VIVELLVSGVLIGLVYALIALGLTIIFGVMDLVNFAHGEFLMLSMYCSFWFYALLGVDPLLTVPVTALFGAALGVLTYYGLIKHVLKGPLLAQLFSTFGLLLFLQNLALFLWGPDFRLVNHGWLVDKVVQVRSLRVDYALLGAGVMSLLGFALMYLLINHTRVGRALIATSIDAEGARYMGIDTDRMNALAWAVGGACVGIAGALLANFFYITPTTGLVFVMLAFTTVALGGFGSVAGALYAGIIIGIIQTFGGLYLGSQFKFPLVYALYFVVMLVRPRGLFGWR
jgi:branched-chain amino acid transport system permease protein